MRNLLLLLALLLASSHLSQARAQESEDGPEIQRTPGVQDLPASERFVATLRTWGDIYEPVHFEVLPLNGTPVSEPILRGVTDQRGIARIELPRSQARLGEEFIGLNVRVSEPGYQKRKGGWRTRRGLPAGGYHFSLPVERGTTRFLRLVDGEGEGVRAQLQWRRAGDVRSLSLASVAGDESLAKGWMALHLQENVRVDLIATREMWVGGADGMAGSLSDVPLLLQGPQTPLTITLNGGHQIAGVARYPDGSPAKNLFLTVRWAGPEDGDELIELCGQPLDDWALQAQGLVNGHTSTGPQGEFLAGGLRPGLYRFEYGSAWLSPGSDSLFVLASPLGVQGPSCKLLLPDAKEEIPREVRLQYRLSEGLVIPEGVASGNLKMQAVSPSSNVQGEVDLYVTSVASGEVVASSIWGMSEIQVDLLPGRYKVSAVGHGLFRTCGLSPHEPRRFGRSETIVQVLAGQEIDETLEIALGGYLNIELIGHAVANDRLQTLRGDGPPQHLSYGLGLLSTRPTIQLIAKDGTQSNVTWYPTDGEGHRHVEMHWPFGETHRSECLPTGTFELVAHMPGGRSARAQVRLESGKTTQVTLSF